MIKSDLSLSLGRLSCLWSVDIARKNKSIECIDERLRNHVDEFDNFIKKCTKMIQALDDKVQALDDKVHDQFSVIQNQLNVLILLLVCLCIFIYSILLH